MVTVQGSFLYKKTITIEKMLKLTANTCMCHVQYSDVFTTLQEESNNKIVLSNSKHKTIKKINK